MHLYLFFRRRRSASSQGGPLRVCLLEQVHPVEVPPPECVMLHDEWHDARLQTASACHIVALCFSRKLSPELSHTCKAHGLQDGGFEDWPKAAPAAPP